MSPPTGLQVLTQFQWRVLLIFVKTRTFKSWEVIGGVMTPPYEG